MYSGNGIYYTEEHSVSFGELAYGLLDGAAVIDFVPIANSWTDWHLIPSSRPVIAQPSVVTKYVEIPGLNGMLDLTTYLTGGPVYGQRNGSLSFKIANGIENIETIRSKMVNTIHGKRMAIVLDDDPDYYYEGRFTVGNIEPASDYSGITITYQLDTYKLRIKSYGSDYPTLWDTFNFETDYDYSILYPSVIVNNSTKTFYIYAENYPFQLSAIWVSGNVDVSFGGVTKNLHAAGSVNLGTASNGSNTLTITGTGSVKIYWRGGSL